MMNRYLALAILLLISSLSHFIVDDHLQVSGHHESFMLDNQSLDDSYPIQKDDSHKIINFTLISLIIIILFLTKSSTFLTNITRRQIFLNPIFYQSNYVIVPLLNI